MDAFLNIRAVPQTEVRVEVGPDAVHPSQEIVAAIRLVVDEARRVRAACWFADKCKVTPVREPAFLDDTSGAMIYSAFVGCEANACPKVSGLDFDNSLN